MRPETTTTDNRPELAVDEAKPIAPSTIRWRRMKARHAAGIVMCPAAEWPVGLLDELVAAGLISERRSLDMEFVSTEARQSSAGTART
jgi:hypothetical protein